MLHGSSSEEFDHVLSTNGPELISMKMWHNIRLSDIWIPSELLSNRENPVQLHLDQPIPFRRLEKLGPIDDSLSIYPQCDMVVGYSNSSSGEKWLDSLEEVFDHLSTCENNDENETINFKVNSSCQEKFQSPSNSIPDLLDYLCRSDSDCEDPVTETIQNPVTAVSIDSVDRLPNSCYQESSLNSLPLPNGSDDLLHELAICQENIEDIKSLPSNKIVLNSEQKEYAHGSVTVSLTSVVNLSNSNLTLESKAHALNQGGVNDVIDNSLCFYEPTHPSVLNNEINDLSCKWATTRDKFTKDSDMFTECEDEVNNPTVVNLDHETSDSEYISDQVPEFLIPYQRAPEDADISCKRKAKKEKRPKIKSAKKIPLDNFFINKSEAAQEKMQTFYENFMKEKHGTGSVSPRKTNVCPYVFPTFEKCDQEFVDKYEMEEAQKSELTLKMVTNLLKESSNTVPINDGDIEKHSVESAPINDRVKIIIENIPLNVDEEMLKSTVQTYGDIGRLILRRNGKTLKAEILMALDDPDWLIDCLSGSHPFGVFSGEGLKCYKRN